MKNIVMLVSAMILMGINSIASAGGFWHGDFSPPLVKNHPACVALSMPGVYTEILTDGGWQVYEQDFCSDKKVYF